ncbi:MAG: lipid kinase [Pseudomonadota bacterium]|nr:lipid kinase [Pseudomonadota bacterium]
MSDRRALLIVNRKSRSGGTDLAAGIAMLRERGLELIEHYPQRPEEVAELIRRHRHQVGRVIVGGGDGTLNSAAGALLDAGLPLGILPMGTANDLARTLMIPPDLVEACYVAADDCLHAIDLGCVNGRHFFNAAGIGLGVRVTQELSGEVKARWGVLGYLRSVLRTVSRHRPFRARVECDGRALRLRSIQITVGNGRFYGGGNAVAEDAALDDRLLDFYSIRPQPLWGLMALAPVLRAGRHDEARRIRRLRGARIAVRTRRPMPVTVDGELTDIRTPATFTVLPAALRVFVTPRYLRERGLERQGQSP